MSQEVLGIPESVSPDGLRARALMMRKTGFESTARHLELAADEIARFRKASRPDDRGDRPELAATIYRMGAVLDGETREAKLTLYQSKKMLGYLVMSSDKVYDVAAHLLLTYDQLEGI